ncbi:DnaJ -like protein subfamily C member 10 [Trichinella pseudospiralis]|uniref:DnaJ homolog subfamily C member 10 n=1 Tax=Trichinella pseudospiralis TaxID=6337 RepID=A0A0V1EP19_TRIPS|nr:DnaJ -like protein subfamily C member 10 [Trichinella pseudospiralis]
MSAEVHLSMYHSIALAIGIFILQFCATNERQYWINCPKECNREDSLSTTLFLEQRQLCTLFSITITSTFVPTVICLKASLAANLKFTSSRDAFETSSVANAEVTQFKLLQPLQTVPRTSTATHTHRITGLVECSALVVEYIYRCAFSSLISVYISKINIVVLDNLPIAALELCCNGKQMISSAIFFFTCTIIHFTIANHLLTELERIDDLSEFRRLVKEYTVSQSYLEDYHAQLTIFAPVDDVFIRFPEYRSMTLKELLEHFVDQQIPDVVKGFKERKTLYLNTVRNGPMSCFRFDQGEQAGDVRRETLRQPTANVPYLRDVMLRFPDVSLIIYGGSGWNQFHTFFLPVNKAFHKLYKRDAVDRDVLLAHVTGAGRVLFTESWLYDYGLHYYPSLRLAMNVIEDNFKLMLTMRNLTDRKTGRWQIYAVSTLLERYEKFRRGSVWAKIVVPNIPVRNGVVHLIDQVLGVVSNTIDQILMEHDQATTLITYIRTIGSAVQTFFTATGGLVTFFAPINEAFDRIPEAVERRLLRDRVWLEQILKLHIVPSKDFTTDQITNETIANTIDNMQHLRFIRGEWPKNNITYYVIGGGVKAAIWQEDVSAVNGIIHFIDRVLGVPYQNMYDIIQNDSSLQMTYRALSNMELRFTLSPWEVLNTRHNFTFFVPTDDAWAKIPAPLRTKMFDGSNNRALQFVMKRHLIQGSALRLPDLRERTYIMMNDQRVMVRRVGKHFELFWPYGNIVAQLVEGGEIAAINGFMHKIDNVMILQEDLHAGTVPLSCNLILFVPSLLLILSNQLQLCPVNRIQFSQLEVVMWTNNVILLLFCNFLVLSQADEANKKDLYALLGVNRTASMDEIKRAYKKMVLTMHPDKNSEDPDAHSKFVQITRAYGILKNAELRLIYDRYGEAGLDDQINMKKSIFGMNKKIFMMTMADFFYLTADNKQHWFIYFYSDMCRRCHDLAPVWLEMVEELDGLIGIGAVNCDMELQLCKDVGIQSVPSFRMFPGNKRYIGEIAVDQLVSYVHSTATVKPLQMTLSSIYRFPNRPILAQLCNDIESCMMKQSTLALATFLDEIITVATVNCISDKEFCNMFDFDAPRLVLFKDKFNLSDFVEIPSGMSAKQIASTVLDHFPVKATEMSIDEIERLLKKKFLAVNVLVEFAIEESTDFYMRKLPQLLDKKGILFRLFNCTIAPQICKEKVFIQKYPTYVIFSKNGGREIYYGPINLHSIMHFAVESVSFNVFSLGPDQFPIEIDLNKEKWIIDFFSPFCPPCMSFLPQFKLAAKKLKGEVNFATINCVAHSALCQQFNIDRYPTTVFYNKSVPFPYFGYHTEKDIVQFIENVISPSVVYLTSEHEFTEKVLNRPEKETWLVEFFLPNCHWCMKADPEIRHLAKMFDGRSDIKVAQVDCSWLISFCSRLGIRQFPFVRAYLREQKDRYIVYQAGMLNRNSLKIWLFSSMKVKITQLTPDDFNKVLNSDEPWLISFFSPRCSYCHYFYPIFRAVAAELVYRVNAGMVDCAMYREFCHSLSIIGVPAVRLYTGEQASYKEVARSTFGIQIPPSEFNEFLATVLASLPSVKYSDHLTEKDEL